MLGPGPTTNDKRPHSSVSKGDADCTGGANQLAVGIDGLHPADGLTNVHRPDAFVAQAYHLAEITLGNQVYCSDTKTRSENSVERSG